MTAEWSTSRRAQDAANRFQRVVSRLLYDAQHARNDSERWLAGYEAGTLLWKVLMEAPLLVDALSDEQEEVDYELHALERRARVLYETLRARRLAAKLEQVEGRTPEEAQAFLAKARQIRSRPDGGSEP